MRDRGCGGDPSGASRHLPLRRGGFEDGGYGLPRARCALAMTWLFTRGVVCGGTHGCRPTKYNVGRARVPCRECGANQGGGVRAPRPTMLAPCLKVAVSEADWGILPRTNAQETNHSLPRTNPSTNLRLVPLPLGKGGNGFSGARWLTGGTMLGIVPYGHIQEVRSVDPSVAAEPRQLPLRRGAFGGASGQRRPPLRKNPPWGEGRTDCHGRGAPSQ